MAIKKTTKKPVKKTVKKATIEVEKEPAKAVKKTVKKADYEDALRLAKELLDKFNNQDEWTEAEEKKLEKLKQVVAILSKLKPLKTKRAAPVVVFDSKKDEAIIKRFLERHYGDISTNTEK